MAADPTPADVPQAELVEARETIRRLNRRCQLAEAAANTRVEDAEKRSKRGIRAYIYSLRQREMGELRDHVAALTRAHAAVQQELQTVVDLHWRPKVLELEAQLAAVVQERREREVEIGLAFIGDATIEEGTPIPVAIRQLREQRDALRGALEEEIRVGCDCRLCNKLRALLARLAR